MERTDKLAARLGVAVRDLGPRIDISPATLFNSRAGARPITAKTWEKLERAERAAGIEIGANAERDAEEWRRLTEKVHAGDLGAIIERVVMEAREKVADHVMEAASVVREDPPPYRTRIDEHEDRLAAVEKQVAEVSDKLDRILDALGRITR